MATVSLNLDRHIKASWSRTKANGPNDNESDVMAAPLGGYQMCSA